ncbi:MAG: ABC transporter permease [Chloroflexi bacterium]|nr:ABC transporter permease [Chloroflexota bacterium]
MPQLLAISGRELRGLLTQRWIMVLCALAALELIIAVGVRLTKADSFDLDYVVFTFAFLGNIVVASLSLDSIAKERSTAAMDIMVTRPVSRNQILAGKLLAYLAISFSVAVLGTAFPVGVAAAIGSKIELSYPLHLVVIGTTLYLFLFAALGAGISIICRSLQSSFALGGAVWVIFSPVVWILLFMQGMSKFFDTDLLARINVINPSSSYQSAVQFFDSFGAQAGTNVPCPTWLAYSVLLLELLIIIAFSAVLFNRQEERGIRE